jgi:Leucine-rich repeat (LRR) protein
MHGIELVGDQAYFSGSQADLARALEGGALDRCGSLVIEGKLPALPPDIGRLRRLRELVIDSDTVATIDPGLFACVALVRLVIGSNQLTALPAGGWRRLAALERLELGGSRALRALPDDLGDAPRLGGPFDLGEHRKLTALPPSFGRLAHVTVLVLPPGDAAPDPIAGMLALHTLELHGVRALPADLGALPRLERLRVHDTEIAALPPGLVARANDLRITLPAAQRAALEVSSADVLTALGARATFS